MANFVAVIDPDRDRRERYCASVRGRVSVMEGLATGEVSEGDFAVVWSVCGRAPLSQYHVEGSVGVVWGDALDRDSGERVSAEVVCERWCRAGVAGDVVYSDTDGDGVPKVLDGYHAAVGYRVGVGLTVGVDFHGLFPLFYWSSGDGVVLVGSSPELFGEHPSFTTGFDPLVMVTLLHTTWGAGALTLQKGVRRLGIGHLMLADSGGGTREVEQVGLGFGQRYAGLPMWPQVDLLFFELDRVVKRQVLGDQTLGMLLSGGMDSRVLAGLLRRAGVSVRAMTLGQPRDYESQFASAVAKRQGFEHTVAEVSTEGLETAMDRLVRWEHCLAGCSGIWEWNLSELMGWLPGRTVQGMIMDAMVGGSHVLWGYDHNSRSFKFERLFERVCEYAWQADQLRRLLRPAYHGLIEEAEDRQRAKYDSYNGPDWRRSQLYDLHHRQRTHVGINAWRSSFGSWPVLPMCDLGLYDLTMNMGCAALSDRCAERELLQNYMSGLAEIPLDRNSDDNWPLKPTLGWMLGDALRKRVTRPVTRAWRRVLSGGSERRHFYRMYDFNGPSWMAIRRDAEGAVESLADYFEVDELRRVLPPAGEAVAFKDGIPDSGKYKTLIGILLWARDHLS